jgi:Rha family phage regulatory protein
MSNLLTTVNKMTSMEIAEITGKRHADIMRDIRDEIEKLEAGGIFGERKFALSSYTTDQNKIMPCYQLSQEGVLQLAARYDAVVRAKLIEKVTRQDMPMNPHLLIATAVIEAQKLIEAKDEQILLMKPKAESFDTFMNAVGNLTIEETAKTLNIPGVGRNKLFDILTFRNILFKSSNSYRAYQEYVNSGYFVHKQVPVKKGDLIEQRTQVFLTPKGLDWLSKKLKKEAV